MKWLIYSIIAITLWSLSACLVKFIRSKHIKSSFSFMFLGIPAMFSLLFLLFLEPFKIGGIQDLMIILITGIMGFIAYVLYLKGLENEEISKVITLYGFGPIVFLLLGVIVLGEKLSIRQSIAFIIIMAAVIILGVEKKLGKFKFKNHLVLVLLSVIIYAIQTFLFKLITHTNYATSIIVRQTVYILLVIGVFMLSTESRKKVMHDIKQINMKNYIILIIAEIIGTMGMVFIFIAMQNGPASLVGLVDGSQVILTIAFATLLTLFFPKIIKEDLSKKALTIKISSVVLMMIGLILLSI